MWVMMHLNSEELNYFCIWKVGKSHVGDDASEF